MTSTIAICKDCKHFLANEELGETLSLQFAKCSRTTRIDNVTGEVGHTHCAIERTYGDCGRNGKFFEKAAEE